MNPPKTNATSRRIMLRKWLARASAGVVTLLILGCEPTVLTLDESLRSRANVDPITNKAKNVILFVGDGMGISTITAARIFDGQSNGFDGESHVLAFERFPNVALIKTYNTNQQVSDSAGTASAMSTGVKTKAGVIGIGPNADRRDCQASLAAALPTLGELARQTGKSVGVVTTTRITHATPAAFYAHSPERDWESNRYMTESDWRIGCRDIAFQLINFADGEGIDVAFGGGKREFLGGSWGGQRRGADDDLISTWLAGRENRQFVTTAEELADVPTGTQVMGLFADDHLTYMADRSPTSTEPMLPEMTSKAIQLLEANKNGYFLLVEGGRIDHGHHDGKAGYALTEAQEFFRAIEAALAKVSEHDTLILVTADHSHTLSISGYPTRNNPILGLVRPNATNGQPQSEVATAADGVPFTTLGYANGPGSIGADSRPVPETGLHAKQQALYPTAWPRIDGTHSAAETHAGEDIALFATGPWSHLAGGVLEQNAIFHIMTHAFGWTEAEKRLSIETDPEVSR